MRFGMAIACVAASIGIAVAGASAAPNQGTAEQRQACMGDAFRLCFWEIPNHRRIEICLKAKRRELSSACHREVFGYSKAR